ncbi:MAG TPA: hypothetical protein VF488_01585, partial [Gemmatimonadaceae bacterium]
TELAIFVTPHVVFNDQQADSLLQRQREQLPASKQSIDSILTHPRPEHRQGPSEKLPPAP